MVNQTHACGEGCSCGKGKKVEPTSALSARVARIVEQVKRLTAPPARSVAQQVEAELEKHPGVAALVNEQTGKVSTFMAPVPYFSLTSEERTALEKRT